MKNAKVILAVALVAAACEKKESAPAAPAAPAAPTPAPAAATPDLATLFPGKAVKLPPTFGSLGFQSTDEDAKKVLPKGPNDHIKLPEFGGDIGLEKVELWGNPIESKAWASSVQLKIKAPVDEVKGKMTAAWGPSLPNKEKNSVWINQADGIEATLKKAYDGSEILYGPILDWQAFLGTGKGFGFEKDKPLYGMSADEIEKTYPLEYYPSEDKKRLMLNFPPLAYSQSGYTKVMVDVDGGKVKSYQITIDLDGHPEAAKLIEQINARITEKWGKPTKKWLNYRNFGKKPTITVTQNPEQFVFSAK